MAFFRYWKARDWVRDTKNGREHITLANYRIRVEYWLRPKNKQKKGQPIRHSEMLSEIQRLHRKTSDYEVVKQPDGTTLFRYRD